MTMSRPKPRIIMEKTDRKNYMSEQILEVENIYAVFYDGDPISIKHSSMISNTPSPRYKRFAFPNSGHAFKLCESLNSYHNTTKFHVVKFTSWVNVEKDDES